MNCYKCDKEIKDRESYETSQGEYICLACYSSNSATMDDFEEQKEQDRRDMIGENIINFNQSNE
jgi:hypothetical protein